MNSIRNALGMRETEIAREPRRPWKPHFYAVFAQVHNTLYPTKPIITIPITLYGYGNGDGAEVGGPEGCAMGREHGEHKRDKERYRYEARSAYLFLNVSPCSYRDRRPARP